MNPIENALLQHLEQEVINKLKQIDPMILVKFIEAQVQAYLQSKMHLDAGVVSTAIKLIETGFAAIYAGFQKLEGK